MNARQITEHVRVVGEIRATLEAELAKPVEEPRNEGLINSVLRNLVRLEVMPDLERRLETERQSANPDPTRVAELVDLIQRLHRGELPDGVRDGLLR